MSLRERLWSNAYLLLTLTALFWAGNAIASRIAVGEISPMLLTGLRWVFVCAIMAPVFWSELRTERPRLARRPWRLVLMAAFGFTGFNLLMYVAASYTTGMNIGLLQGAMPAMIILGALFAYGTPISPTQAVGVAITMLGAAVIATGGDPAALRTMSLNRGDVMMLIANFFYAGYTVMARDRPPIRGLVFFTALALIAGALSVPAVAAEYWTGRLLWPTATGWLVVAYVALFPSLLAQLFFLRGIDLVGPGRSGLFINLLPVFTAILAVMILHEPFGWSQALALALVLGGIALAERRPPPRLAGEPARNP